MEDDETLWTFRELANYLGYAPTTIQSMVTQKADRLPPRVECLGRPRWVPSVVRAWVVEQSTRPKPATRGRPRTTPTIE
ncbi:hypothetical protein C9I56_06980 [Paraburkholderia caribensis]|nr:hypothetical protein C9I56_06980 [Paraburkholderia caribensis]